MIPKTLHYCWFGGAELSPLAHSCIASWKRVMPEYEIRRWDESTLDVDDPFVEACIEQKKWAFLSDRVRFDVLYNEGGIYLDVDVEAVRSMDELLNNRFFAGWECGSYINAAVVGAVAGSAHCRSLAKMVERSVMVDRRFVAVPKIITPYLNERLADADHDVTVYPSRYFYPYNPYDKNRPVQQLMASDISVDTFAIHHWQKQWSSGKQRKNLIQRARKFLFR